MQWRHVHCSDGTVTVGLRYDGDAVFMYYQTAEGENNCDDTPLVNTTHRFMTMPSLERDALDDDALQPTKGVHDWGTVLVL